MNRGTIYNYHHISIVFPLPPPPRFYCFPSTTITTFLLFSLYHHHHVSIVFPLPPSPHLYCFPPPPSHYYCFPTSPPHFYCFPSSTSTTSSSLSLLFECGLLGFSLASLAFSRENNRHEEEEVEEVEVEEDDEEEKQ